jgi:hypothetical protein
MVLLDKQLILSVAKSRDIYETPDLNDNLFLHGLGISSISHLPEYTNIVFLSLEQNSLTSLSVLNQFLNLRYLNVNNNSITSIDFWVDLGNLDQLEQLHASHNSIQNFVCEIFSPPKLKILNLSHNKLNRLPNVSMMECLEVFNVSKNAIDDCDIVNSLKIYLPKTLKQLYLGPNPFVSSIKRYRRTVLSTLANESITLTYFDNAFVTAEEMEIVACIDANEEISVRKKFEDMRREELNRRVSDLRDLQLMHDDTELGICQYDFYDY